MSYHLSWQFIWRTKMGEDTVDYQLFRKFYPIRKYAFIASVLFITLSFLVVVECAFVLTDTIKFSNPVLVTFSYFLASFLVLIGLIGLRYSYMSATTIDSCNQSIVVESPGTSPIWLSTNIQQFPDQDLLPGTVRPDGIYPQPPPRYSSLGDVVERNSANGRRITPSSRDAEAKP